MKAWWQKGDCRFVFVVLVAIGAGTATGLGFLADAAVRWIT